MAKRVLIVEDSPTEALRARLFLEREGFQVTISADGKEGLSKAASELPDLIVLDAIMPRMSGYEVWEQLRADPKTLGIPVVMITTATIPSEVRLGSDGFIAKPYEPGMLVSKVKEMSNGNGHGGGSADSQALQEQLRQTQEELARARQEAAAAQRMRSEFLANMSHELRTPLYGVMGMTDLVLGTEITAEQREFLTTAKASANALLAIVGDMLEFSELGAGQLDLESKDFQVQDVLAATMENMQPRAQEKGLQLSSLVAGDLPHMLSGDPRRLRQVLDNLIGNAVKFTEQGKVTVQVEGKVGGDDVELHICVSDTGIGIPKDKLGLVFEVFQQADGSTTRRYGGTGLGLAMAKQLVTRMGGRIWAESEEAQGSAFHFTVPMKRPQNVAAPAAVAETKRSLRILLAEDSPTNQLIARANLGKAGHVVTVAVNGRKAVDAWAANEFDLILMDVAMPEMDGLEATKAIRAQEKTSGKHIPIVAMTAFALKEYQDKCHDAGMDGYVSKPISPDELQRALEPILAKHGPVAPAPPAVTLSEALEVVGGDVDLLKEVVGMSLEECPEQITSLRDAVAQNDAKGTERAAHRLKGIMGNLGGLVAREWAQRLETMGTDGNLQGGSVAVQNFVSEFGRVNSFYAAADWERLAAATQ